jgi:hypothetical protein
MDRFERRSMGRSLAACLIALAIVDGIGVSPARSDSPGAEPGTPPPPSIYGGFALADSSGTWVRALMPVVGPERVRVLLAAEGREFPVRYEPNPPDSAGAGATELGRLAGQRFRVEGGRVWPAEVCFLASDSLLASAAPVPIRRNFRGCERDEYSENRLESSKGRSVVGCWDLAAYGNSMPGAVQLYEFAPLDSTYLASLALWDDTTLVTYDFHGQAADSSGIWRVDDEGQLDAEGFEVQFVLRGESRRFVGVGWIGGDGEVLWLLESRDGADFREVARGHRSPGRR